MKDNEIKTHKDLPVNLKSGPLPKYWIWGDDDRPAKYENQFFYIIERGQKNWSKRNDLALRISKEGRYVKSEDGLKDWLEKVKQVSEKGG